MPDIYTLGAARVTDASGSNILPVVKLQLEVDPESGDAEDFGEVPLMPCLGLTALPAPPDDSGRAEGLAIEGAGGFTAVVAGARDARCVDVVGKMKSGETCVHNTGGTKETRARAFFKENCASVIVGNDLVLMLDRKNKKITITGFGHIFELSETNGVILGAKGGKNGIQLNEDGSVYIWGTSVNLGGHSTPGTPATSVIMGPSGMTGVPAPNVFITM